VCANRVRGMQVGRQRNVGGNGDKWGPVGKARKIIPERSVAASRRPRAKKDVVMARDIEAQERAYYALLFSDAASARYARYARRLNQRR